MTKKFQTYKMPKKSFSNDEIPNLSQSKEKNKDKHQTPLEYFGE